jgi:hypothetical protein
MRFVEELFGLSPDNGDGAFEAAIFSPSCWRFLVSGEKCDTPKTREEMAALASRGAITDVFSREADKVHLDVRPC